MRLRLEDSGWPVETCQVVRLVGATAARLRLPVYLVGGPVRDLLLQRATLDLDLAVEGETAPLAQALAAALGGTVTAHNRFGTASVHWASSLHLDLACTREETYPQPGALPEVAPAALADDLRRRDFTIHALALRLDEFSGEVIDVAGGRLDLQLGLLRGLHPRTFVDDPTRVLRAARYAATLDLTVERETLAWLRTAVTDGVLQTVTGPRLWGELERLLGLRSAPAACSLLQEWGALAALGLDRGEALSRLEDLYDTPFADEAYAAARAAALGLLAGEGLEALAADYKLSAADRDAALAARAVAGSPPAVLFAGAAKNSTLYAELGERPRAAWLALWATCPTARDSLRRLPEICDRHLAITGEDLRQAGYRPGRDFGPALAAARVALLDENADRDGQLQAALRHLSADDGNQA